MSIISENQRLHDKQKKEQNFTTVPVNLSLNKWRNRERLKEQTNNQSNCERSRSREC